MNPPNPEAIWNFTKLMVAILGCVFALMAVSEIWTRQNSIKFWIKSKLGMLKNRRGDRLRKMLSASTSITRVH